MNKRLLFAALFLLSHTLTNNNAFADDHVAQMQKAFSRHEETSDSLTSDSDDNDMDVDHNTKYNIFEKAELDEIFYSSIMTVIEANKPLELLDQHNRLYGLLAILIMSGYEPAHDYFIKCASTHPDVFSANVLLAAQTRSVDDKPLIRLFLLHLLIDCGYEAGYDTIIAIAQEEMTSSALAVRESATNVLRHLALKNYQPAYNAITSTTTDVIVLDANNKVNYNTIDKTELDEIFYGIVMNSIQEEVTSECPEKRVAGYNLLAVLMMGDYEPARDYFTKCAATYANAFCDDVLRAAQFCSGSNPVDGLHLMGLFLCSRLVEFGYASEALYDTMTAIAQEAIASKALIIREEAGFALWYLVEKNYQPAYDAATTVATHIITYEEGFFFEDGVEIFLALVNRNHQAAFAPATAAAKKAITHYSAYANAIGLKLAAALQERGITIS